jgi:hypothetical protein
MLRTGACFADWEKRRKHSMRNNLLQKTGARAGSSFHLARRFAVFGALALTLICVPWANAQADTGTGTETETEAEVELRTERVRWQEKYRSLLTETARLHSEIQQESELYADANRRNYRRGSKRHYHREAIDAAKHKLAELETELADFEDVARRGGAARGWLTQVEIELEDEARGPAVTAGPGDEGRNPLYLESR